MEKQKIGYVHLLVSYRRAVRYSILCFVDLVYNFSAKSGSSSAYSRALYSFSNKIFASFNVFIKRCDCDSCFALSSEQIQNQQDRCVKRSAVLLCADCCGLHVIPARICARMDIKKQVDRMG